MGLVCGDEAKSFDNSLNQGLIERDFSHRSNRTTLANVKDEADGLMHPLTVGALPCRNPGRIALLRLPGVEYNPCR